MKKNIIKPKFYTLDKESVKQPKTGYIFLKHYPAKLNENKQREIKSLVSKRPLETPYEEQFNELLLYVFTGFFLLMIYDNIYKLGKETTFY